MNASTNWLRLCTSNRTPALAFDLLEGLKHAYRAAGQEDKARTISAGFSRATGGIDVPWLIEQLGPGQ